MPKINPTWLEPALPRPASTNPSTPLDCPQNGVTKLELFVACALISLAGRRGLSLNNRADEAVKLATDALEKIDAYT